MPRQPLSKQEMSSPDGHKVTDNQSFKVPQRSAAAGLFPAYAGASGPQAAGWLQNASFPAMPAQPKAAPGTEEQEARSKLCKLMLECFTLVHDAVSGQYSKHVFFSGLRLKQAAEQLLPSSSSDSESEGGTAHLSGEVSAPACQTAQVSDSDGSSEESCHRKHKRQREHSKQRKHKKNRFYPHSASTVALLHQCKQRACCMSVANIVHIHLVTYIVHDGDSVKVKCCNCDSKFHCMCRLAHVDCTL